LLSLLLAIGPVQAQPSQIWAIVIGIDEYVRPSIPKLRYAVADAKLFSQALQDTIKVPRDHIFLMTSDAVDENNQPRFVNVAYRLSALKGKVKKDDTVIFYFAGHGVTLDGEPFLLTEEADNRSALTLKASSLHGGDLITTLRKTESGNCWVMLDACRNSPNEKEESKLDPTVSQALSQANVGLHQTATMFSCKVGERAWEWDEKKHGCYSYFLVEGLRRDAADPQGRVTLQGLADYVSQEVPKVAKQFGSSQNPTMFYGGPTAGQWVLANVSGVAPAALGKKDADTSLHVAKLEALQARLDEESALRVKADQRAKVAEMKLQEAMQRLAVLETMVGGKPRAAVSGSLTENRPLAYAEGPLDPAQHQALLHEIARLERENSDLKKRLAGLEVQATKVGMMSREVMFENQPMLKNAWLSASQQENQGSHHPEPRQALQRCLSVRDALIQQVTLYQTGCASTLSQRPLSPAQKKELALQLDLLDSKQLLTHLYQSRLEAAEAALREAQNRLQEALLREQKYQAIIAGLQSELAAKEAELVQCRAELAEARGQLSKALSELKKLQERAARSKAMATSPDPQKKNIRLQLHHLFEDGRNFTEREPTSLPPQP
jgi:hypothetical protein